jgi:site-specific DNA-methyltransferase (adenine-specific)
LGDNGLSTIPDKSIDMILCDPPYAITANKWDKPLDLVKMFKEYDRIIKDNGAIVLFGNQPFTTDLINAYRKNFKYSLVWDKNFGTDFFNCNRKPLKSHEDIIVFYKKNPTYNAQMEEGKPYKMKSVGEHVSTTGMTKTRTQHTLNNKGTRFPKSVIKVDYTEDDEYEMEEHKDILIFYKKQPTYNPQKEEGKPYTANRIGCVSSSGIQRTGTKNEDGKRFPKSVIKVDYTEDDEYEMEEHEDIIVFYKKQPTYNPQKEEGKPYTIKGKKGDIPFSGLGEHRVLDRTTIENNGTRFPKSVIKVDYTEDDEYEMEEHEDIIVFYKKQPTYNPQKEEGKPYKAHRKQIDIPYMQDRNFRFTEIIENKDGTRFPKSILKFKRETGKHTTQKPVKLCEWLIKTYTNEGETVLDNTMGSGTTGVACINTNRKFVGFELDEKYFNVAKERIEQCVSASSH